MSGTHMLPSLPYAYDALEPYISRYITGLHHKKHHQTYANALNTAEQAYAKAFTPRERIALQVALRFNSGGESPQSRESLPRAAGENLRGARIGRAVRTGLTTHARAGHINHSLFWKNLAPAHSEGAGGTLAAGPLKDALDASFGSVDAFKKEFSAATAGIQGSGWGWLGLNPGSKRLEIVTTSNPDPLIIHIRIIGVDIWEHAFYLQYLNVKVDYLNAIWNVVNWDETEKRYQEGLAGKVRL